MRQAKSADAEQLTEFNRNYSREGLFLRYARGRVAYFASRQIMTVLGGFVLFVMNGPINGVAAVLIAIFGEAVDCLYLRGAKKKLSRGVIPRHFKSISTVSAGFQAMTISICVGLSWFGMQSQHSPLFAIAFIGGAALNAGIVMPFHKTAAMARLGVYGAATCLFFVIDLVMLSPPPPGFAMNAVATLMFALMVYAFLAFVNGSFRRNRRHTLALVRQGRKLAETNAALLRREKEAHQLSLVAKNANDSVVLGDPDGHITWVNDAFTRITGFTADEAIGALPGDLLGGRRASPDMVRKIRTAIRNGEPIRGELKNVTKDGRSIWIETNQVPVLDARGDVEMVVAIERDITAAKRHAKEMAEAKRAAEEGARAKAEFLATMSHEIRTPMNGVIGMADLICETRLSEEQRLYADTIRSSAMALLTIINDILDLSKLDAEKMQLNPVAFDLEDCFKDTVHLLYPQAQDKSIDLTLELDFALLRSARADDGRLRQILINLIGNAIKFTETGGVVVRASVRSVDGEFRLCVDVEDSGIGIAEDMMAHVFERFSQAEADTARRFGGTGLGLTISRLLVEKMGGRISVSSKQGVGSCFSFWIGIEPVTELPESRESNLPIAPEGAWGMDGMRILVAEDNKVNRLLISKFLRDVPVELHFAHDGHQAVIMTEQQRPDLIFMDMSMPVIDGIEATRRIRSGDGHQPVIVALTANAFDSDREICLSVGMDGFLTKPVGRGDLLEAISRHLPEVAKRSAG